MSDHATRMKDADARLAALNESIERKKRAVTAPAIGAPSSPAPKVSPKKAAHLKAGTIDEIATELVNEMTNPETRRGRKKKGVRMTDAIDLVPQTEVNEELLEEQARNQIKKLDPKTGRMEKGANLNPWGRKGKSGKGGFLFRTGFTAFAERLTEEERVMMWQAMFQKAAQGDVQAFKFLTQFNMELDQPKVEVEADTGVRISLTVPPRED